MDKNLQIVVEGQAGHTIINDDNSSSSSSYIEGSYYSTDKSRSGASVEMQKPRDSDPEEKKYMVRSPIDISKDRYPFCIVWTPLPLISWFLPCIGHTGICGSDGKIYDFAGSYFISADNMAFGRPYKYVQLNPDMNEQEKWDDCVAKCNERFVNEEHNICINNCHSHVAHALNLLNYKNKSTYNMIHIWWMCIAHSKYVSYGKIFKAYLGFVVLLLFFFLMLKL